MLKGCHYDKSKRNNSKENPCSSQSRNDCKIDSRSRESWQHCRDLPKRKHSTQPILSLESEVFRGGGSRFKGSQARPQKQGSRQNSARERSSTPQKRSLRVINRIAITQKKRELGLHGSLKKRHLPTEVRKSLCNIIDEARKSDSTASVAALCAALELNPRAYYRWKVGKDLGCRHGGGGGLNKVTPNEIKKVLSTVHNFPHHGCRRIAYHLERKATAFIGKSKVAEIMRDFGLNHPFIKGTKKPTVPPADMLLHEPYRKNLLWGADWTWLHVNSKFMYLLVVLDWYSRKILSWGLFHQITSFEVTATITDAIALEEIDLLPRAAMKPRIVLDHGSANISSYTRKNIEIQGLELWLSGIGRPTGNARTERVIGTLKHEEISLQEEYSTECEARTRISAAIEDYNFYRPNAGNGGFAPNSVHHMGRKELTDRRQRARNHARTIRMFHWRQETKAETSLS
jgi:putative transposase